MGADLSMNPPDPDRFEVKREGNILVLMRKRSTIYRGENGEWREVWRGGDDQGAVDLLTAAGHSVPPRPDDVHGIVTIDITRILKARCGVPGCNWKGDAQSGAPGAIDDFVGREAETHAATHGPNVTVRRLDQTGGLPFVRSTE